MTLSSSSLGFAGIVLSFMPDEVLKHLSSHEQEKSVALMLQLLGALYFGFAMINWTGRANLVAGIYGRPIAIGNLSHLLLDHWLSSRGFHPVWKMAGYHGTRTSLLPFFSRSFFQTSCPGS